jgi:hypothetical protein
LGGAVEISVLADESASWLLVAHNKSIQNPRSAVEPVPVLSDLLREMLKQSTDGLVVREAMVSLLAEEFCTLPWSLHAS